MEPAQHRVEAAREAAERRLGHIAEEVARERDVVTFQRLGCQLALFGERDERRSPVAWVRFACDERSVYERVNETGDGARCHPERLGEHLLCRRAAPVQLPDKVSARAGETAALQITGHVLVQKHREFKHAIERVAHILYFTHNEYDTLFSISYPVGCTHSHGRMLIMNTSSPDANIELVHAGVDAFNANDTDSCLALMAPDLVMHLAELPEPLQGREAWRLGFALIKSAFPDLHIDVDDIVAADDRIAVRLTLHGTHTGEYLGFAATGRPIRYASHEFYRVADGLIAEEWICSDTATLFRQLS